MLGRVAAYVGQRTDPIKDPKPKVITNPILTQLYRFIRIPSLDRFLKSQTFNTPRTGPGASIKWILSPRAWGEGLERVFGFKCGQNEMERSTFILLVLL